MTSNGDSPEQLTLLRDTVRTSRTKEPAGITSTLPVARIAVDVSLPHLDRPFDYLVPEDLAEAAQPGVRVKVRFAQFDEATATAYVGTREPMDKAGAYGIQGYGATLVERIEGDFFAVMGLPISRMMSLLNEAGLMYDFRDLRFTDPDA